MARPLLPGLLRSIFPAAFLLAAAVVLFWPVLGGGRRLFWGDLGLYFVPLLSVQQETLVTGRIALWNPTILCGTPLWGNPQAFPLYPSSLLLWLLPAPAVVGVIAALHVWLAAWGTFSFLRGRGLTTGAALFGAMAWGMGGAVVSKAQFPNMSQAAAFLPWLLLFVDGVANKPRPLAAAKLGFTVGLALLAAHPQIFLMQFYVGAAWAVFRLRSGPGETRRAASCLAAGVVLGMGLAAGQLLPCMELVRASVRTHLSLHQANRFILPPYELLTNFVAPNFYGNPATDTDYVGRGNFWEPCAYIGVLPFVFGLWAAFRLFRANHEVRFWAVAAVIGVWLAVGKDGGLWAIAFYVLPGVSKFHDAARWLHVGTFGLACLAAWGMDAVLRARPSPISRQIWAAGLIALAACDVVAFGSTLNPTTPSGVWEAARHHGHEGNTKTRAFFADESRAWTHWVSYRTYRATETDADAFLFLASRTPNTGGLSGGGEAGGYEPVRRATTDAVLTQLKAEMTGSKKSEAGVSARAMGVGGVTRLNAQFSPETRPLTGASARAVFVSEIASSVPVALSISDPSPQKVTVWLPVPHSAGTVFLADTLHPGWTARVDNRLAPIDLARGAFRGVRVGKNDKRVDFVYEPASVRVGVFISLGALGILTAITFGERRKKKDTVRRRKGSTAASSSR